MSTPSIDPIFGVPENLVNDNIQSTIELVYVKQANDLLNSKMADLEKALTVTKNVMDTLTTLQNAHNGVTTESRVASDFDYDRPVEGDEEVSEYTGKYVKYASDTYGKPIAVTFIYSENAAGFTDFKNDLLNSKQQLIDQITQLSEITKPLENGQPDPNSLLAKLKKVLADLNNYDLNTYSGVAAWTLDSYNAQGTSSSSKAGAIQQNLTAAFTAGQSLNDTQKEDVRNFLNFFDQFYKSATAMLQKISQIIEKMGQNIKP